MKYSQCVTRWVRFVVFTAILLKGTIAFSFEEKPRDLAVYPAPANAVLNTDFTVKVRQNG
jgi:hypothetical protein